MILRGVPPALTFVPEHLLAKTFPCGHCGQHFTPAWLTPRPYPMGSIEAQGGCWVRLSAQDKCPSCDRLTEIALPVKERKAVVPLFGDEAVRDLSDEGALLFTYSLIGASKPFVAEIEEQIKGLKRRLRPALSPDEWKIHMTVLWSGQQRRKRPEFSDWGKSETDALITGIGDILSRAGPKLFKYSIVLAGKPVDENAQEGFKDHVQKEAYVLLVMRVIDAITDLGGQPVLHFDSQKAAKADVVIHQWARDTFRNGQGNLLYSFLSHSIFVPEPIFVPPASHPLLEVADFMSFAVARHHFRAYQGAVSEIDLRVLGQVCYMTFAHDGGDLLYQTSVGFPWQLDFGTRSN